MLRKRVVSSILISILMIAAIFWSMYAPNGKLLHEYITGETPQAKLNAYVYAIADDDLVAALDQWELPHLSNQDQLKALAERRKQVTSEIS